MKLSWQLKRGSGSSSNFKNNNVKFRDNEKINLKSMLFLVLNLLPKSTRKAIKKFERHIEQIAEIYKFSKSCKDWDKYSILEN